MELTNLKGVAAATQAKLNKLGIMQVEDIIDFLPKKLFDMTQVSQISPQIIGDYALLEGSVTKISKVARINKMLNFFRAEVDCNGIKLKLVWFNSPYLASNLAVGESYCFWSKLNYKDSAYEMTNPSFEKASDRSRLCGIVPIYPLKNIINQKSFRGYLKQSLKMLAIKSMLDDSQIISLEEAYKNVHFPETLCDYDIAIKRLATEKLVTQIVAHKIAKNMGNKQLKNKFALSIKVLDEFIDNLPYKLTRSQSVAIEEIVEDLRGKEKTNRMLVGDVGSGKTVVALASIYYAIKCGWQCCLMSPTAVLAQQHYATAVGWLESLGIKIRLLLGSTIASQRRKIEQEVANGEVDLLIGTHAVIGDKIEFKKLGFVVIDELHKFGVRQKSLLENKGNSAEVLVMSATPIPRAVALSWYGDIKISRLESRKTFANISTHIIGEDKLNGLYSFVQQRVLLGEQAYIVCPLIEDSEGVELYSANTLYEELCQKLNLVKIGLIHGKQCDKVKSQIMTDFMNGKVQVVVSTSVIEVGIDCKNASIMIILNADRFGLASLHQLRGRVGRNPDLRSFCFIHCANKAENERLMALRDNDDGNVIAEIDANNRGYGDFLGFRQSGGNNFLKYDASIIENAKILADSILTNKYEYALQQREIVKLLEEMQAIALF